MGFDQDEPEERNLSNKRQLCKLIRVYYKGQLISFHKDKQHFRVLFRARA
jgi:hypothetical protein